MACKVHLDNITMNSKKRGNLTCNPLDKLPATTESLEINGECRDMTIATFFRSSLHNVTQGCFLRSRECSEDHRLSEILDADCAKDFGKDNTKPELLVASRKPTSQNAAGVDSNCRDEV